MDLFQKVSEKTKGLQEVAREIGGKAKEVTRKSGELLEVTKMKYEMSKMEKEMENNLAGLGALVYQKYRGATDVDDEIDRLCVSTTKLEEDIKELQQQIDKLQPKSMTCPECKIELPIGSKFCCYCGLKMAKEE